MKLTETAITKITNLLDDEEDALALRVGVVGGGCSGFNYTFSFADEIIDGDFVHKESGVTVVVDPMSLMYLEDVTIDYAISLAGSMFTVDNPSATTTCGCGTSFSV